jgi:curved DNA-binding protein CbpA
MIDYYRVLEINNNATEEEIKYSYRRLSKKFHPDNNPNDLKAEETMKAINEAYSILSDPVGRSDYDMLYSLYKSGLYNDNQDNYYKSDGFNETTCQNDLDNILNIIKSPKDIFNHIEFFIKNYKNFTEEEKNKLHQKIMIVAGIAIGGILLDKLIDSVFKRNN